MNSQEFSQKVFQKQIKNGTIFDVSKENIKIGQVGVIRDTVVYLEFKDGVIPSDLLVGNYEFTEVIEGE